jgi:hypothetical protein
MNERGSGPATPALRILAGQAPLVYVTRVPADSNQPGWELAVFDDGTLVYEGHRCVEVDGLLVMCLRPDDLTAVRGGLEALCSDLQSNLASWVGPPTRRLACAPGSRDLSPHDLARTVRPDLTPVESREAFR